MSTGSRAWPRRLAPAALVAWLALLGFVRLGDPFGDRGMSNVATGGLLALAALALGLAVLRRLPLRRRLVVLGTLSILAAIGALALRYEGVSGAMIPRLAWRGSSEPVYQPAPGPLPAPDAPCALELAAPSPRDFPGFLGPERDNAVPGVRLARDWQRSAPREVWRAPIGAGWSAFAVAGGAAFTLEQDASAQRASARSLTTGELAWSVAIDRPFHHVLGGDGPRATPAVADGRVHAQSAHGRLVCLAARDGELLWAHDLAARYGMTEAAEEEHVLYGRSGSPLVAGELVIVPAGGLPSGRQAGLVAFDRRDGTLRWEGPPRQLSHSSPRLATLAGVEQVLIVNEASLSGHSPDDGRLLWEHPWPGQTSSSASVSQAVPVGPASVFVSKGYGGGALLLALEDSPDGTLRPREVWRDRRLLRTKLTNVVLHDGFVYGLDDGMLECVELASGERRWKEGRYGHGQILLAGDLLLVCSEEGEVLALEPDPLRANAVLGRFQGLEGKCWAHLALAGELLLLRNAEQCAAWALPLRED